MKKQVRTQRAAKKAKSRKEAKHRIDLSGCKLILPYGRDPHALESLSAIGTKVGTSKVGLRGIGNKK